MINPEHLKILIEDNLAGLSQISEEKLRLRIMDKTQRFVSQRDFNRACQQMHNEGVIGSNNKGIHLPRKPKKGFNYEQRDLCM